MFAFLLQRFALVVQENVNTFGFVASILFWFFYPFVTHYGLMYEGEVFVATLIHSVFWVPAKVWYGQQVRCFVGPNGVPNPCSFLGNMARVSRGPPMYVGQPHMIENSQFQCVTVCDHHPYTNVGEHKASFGVDSLACPWMLQGGLGRWSIGTPSAKKKNGQTGAASYWSSYQFVLEL